MRGRRTGAVAALGALGLVLFALGTGVAWTYVAVATWPADTVSDRWDVLARWQFVVAALVGLVGLGCCAVAIGSWWRRSPGRRRRAAGILVVALAVAFVGAPVGEAAVALWPASAPRWIAGPALADPTLSQAVLAGEAPIAAGRLVAVETTTSDGVVLRGEYAASRNRAAVVVLPGSLGTRDSVVAQGAVLAAQGFGVLLLDPRGNGDSGGRPDGSGWSMPRDLAAAVDWLERRPDVDRRRIGVLGESLGGEAALTAIADDSRIRAVVAEGVTGVVAADWDWLPAHGGLLGPLRWLQYRAGYVALELGATAAAPSTLASSVAGAGPRPVLLIVAGTEDDEREAAETLRVVSPSTVQVWEVSGAPHAGGLQTATAAWRQRVGGFLQAALVAPAA